MSISGYIKATCRQCKKSIDWYCSPIPSSDAELIYTCDECIEKENIENIDKVDKYICHHLYYNPKLVCLRDTNRKITINCYKAEHCELAN